MFVDDRLTRCQRGYVQESKPRRTRDEAVGSPLRTGQTRWSDCLGVREFNLVLVAPVHLINTVSARSNRAIWKMMMQGTTGFAPMVHVPNGSCLPSLPGIIADGQ